MPTTGWIRNPAGLGHLEGKTRLRTRLLILALSLGLLLIGGGVLIRYVEEPGRAPDVVFTTLRGERIALSDLRGRPVLVTFWASNCRQCREEMPSLVDLYRDYAPRGLQIVAVAMPYDMPSQVVAVTNEHPLPYPVALDPQGTQAKAFGDVTLVPNSFLISPKGYVALHTLGLLDMAALRSQINSMLPEI